jgi:hypothetical protein
MKKNLAIIIGCIIIISSISAVALPKQSSQQQKETIICSDPMIFEDASYCSILLSEATTYLKNPGQPILPILTKTFTFPIGTIISEISCTPNIQKEKTLTKEIIYAQKPVIRSTELQTAPTVKDQMLYEQEQLYPDTWFTYTIGVGLEGTNHVTYVTIQMYPIRYSPLKNQILYTDSIDISINYELSQKPTSFSDSYDLVIIAPQQFAGKLQRLVDHKIAMGIPTKLVTTQEIHKNYEGRDQAEQIKYFLKYAIEEYGTSYVMLFGGMKGQRFWSWYVPMRYANLDDASDFETKYISDVYFEDIYKYDNTTGYTFDTWDSNENNIFAEWNTDNKDVLDMYPDVYVGRLPCQYKFEVDAIIDRIITYETTTNGQSWFNSMVGIGGDSFDDINWNTSTDYIEGQEETNHSLNFMTGFTQTRVWVDGGDVLLSPENISAVISQGHGFVVFSGHGNPSSWATHPHADFNTWIDFGLSSIKELTNGEKRPILIVGGCHNSQFDVSILKIFSRRALMWGEATQKCWSWLMATVPDGGSIATIGCTGLGYGTIGDGPTPPDEIPGGTPDGIPDCIQYLGGWIESHFFDVYNNDHITVLGQTHGTTLTDYLNQFPIDWNMDWDEHEQSSTLADCKTVQEWALIGDPSLQIGGYPQ